MTEARPPPLRPPDPRNPMVVALALGVGFMLGVAAWLALHP